MHITKLSLVNYRNFKSAKLLFNKGINTIIGENGSGKTNLFRAMRLLLDNSMPRFATKLSELDFCRAIGDWRGHWIIISLEFDDIAADEASQALFLHGLGNAESSPISTATYNLIFRPKAYIRQALSNINPGDRLALDECLDRIQIDDYETIFTGKSIADFNDLDTYINIVGDFERVRFPKLLNDPAIGIPLPNILNVPNEVSFTFIKALRDVVSDFHSNRTNPLLTLLKFKSGEIDNDDFQPVADLIGSLNSQIEGLSDICEVRDDIVTTISDTVGDTYSPNSISIRSSLSDKAEQLFQSLKLFVGESSDGYEGSIHEMSLGGANLLYLTLKILEFKYQKANQSIANFLLIEEPEAHIHTHIQKTLFDKIRYDNTQIIYSTHSSHISEVSNVKNMNIIGFANGVCDVFQPSSGLSIEQIGFVQRYLDAIRSNLLFAKSVVLVEGDAEEILIPILIKKTLGLSLDELGISLVNIRSTGFENVAMLFDDKRIKKRCSIITDLDKAFFDTNITGSDSETIINKKKKASNSQQSGNERKNRLDTFSAGNPWVEVFYSDHTFEVDFVKNGNSNYLSWVLKDVYSDKNTIALSESELSSGDIAVSGTRALTMANHNGKGWFAITLGKVIDFNVNIPDYIIDAIIFAHGSFDDSLILKVIGYRYQQYVDHVSYGKKQIDILNSANNIELRDKWIAHLKPYEHGLEIFTKKWNVFDLTGDSVRELKDDFVKDMPLGKNKMLSRM